MANTVNMLIANSKKRQAGVTLVELLIAMMLAAFLMAGIVQVFLGSRQSSDVVNAQARMQESARFALMFLNRSVRMAGYLSEVIEPDSVADVTIKNRDWRSNLIPVGAGAVPFEAEAFIFGENAGSAVVANKAHSDTLSLRVQGTADGAAQDCQGRALADGVWGEMTFYIDDDDNFRCRSDDGASVQDVTLVEGVEELQFQFGMNAGVAAPADPVEEPTRVVSWDNADGVAAGNWKFIVSVKAALVAASDSEALSTLGPAISYDLLDYTTPDYTDGRARQQFAQSIRIRNQLINSEAD